MKLVLKYFGGGMDGRDSEKCFPIEAESKKAARQALRDAVAFALEHDQHQFVLFDQIHYLHNFISRVSTAQMQMMTVVRKRRNLPEPKWLTRGDGLFYAFSPIALEILTTDEWFAAAQSEASTVLESNSPGVFDELAPA